MAVLRVKNRWLLLIMAAALLLAGASAAVAQDSGPSPQDDMVSIGATTFEMGEAAEVMLADCELFRTGCDIGWFNASQPAHTVQVDPFSIDLYEVTNESFLEFISELGMVDGACNDEDCIVLEDSAIELGDDLFVVEEELLTHPVSGVSWYGANAYCEWRGGRLPTEAEWELAAGWDFDNESKLFYPWGDEFDGNATNFCDANCSEQQANSDYDDGYETTAPVGSYEDGRSSAGLYDTAGNLWEWVDDWYDPTYYSDSPEENPTGPATGDNKVVRGGSWFDTGNFTSTAVRFPAPPDESGDSIGFRCASDEVDESQMMSKKPADSEAAETQDQTATPTAELAATVTREPEATATKKPTATATKEPTATATKEPTVTATKEPTATATKEPTATATKEPTATATKVPTATATKEPTATATKEPTAEPDSEEETVSVAPVSFNCDMYPGEDRGDTYVIGACDWLVKIADNLGVSYAALLAENPQITDPNIVQLGQVINVPARVSGGASETTSATGAAPVQPAPTGSATPEAPLPPSPTPAKPSGSSLKP